MNTINVFNKQVLELHSNFLKDFIDKLKVDVPEEVHTIMDEQLKTEQEVIKLNIKNINKKNKKIINKDTPKKPTKANCWRLFCTHRSKELTETSQSEKWGLCSAEWAELKLNGGDQYWKDMADKLNSELSDSNTSIVSNVEADNNDSDAEQAPEPTTPPKAASKKAAPKKAKAAPEAAPARTRSQAKAAPIIKEVAMVDEEYFDDGYNTPSDEPDDNINEQDV